jgi:acyl-CoA thioester hydrolase
MKAARPVPNRRSDFVHFVQITTRWMDNDVYGHVNNVVYYSFFDTAVNQFLIEQGALDVASGASIGLVVHTECDYFAPLSFPGNVEAGLRVAAVGASSVTYEIGLFGAGDESSAASGRFVHVYVDRASRRPQPLPEPLRRALAALG